MKKNGFTLVELLGVTFLLGVIALLLVPTIRGVMRDAKQELYDEQINLIESGLKNWANSNIFLLPDDNNSIKLSLGQLKQAGFAETIIKNPKSNKCFSNESILVITKYNNTYIYDAKDMIDVDGNLIEDVPTIKLNGSIVEYLDIGDTYTDLGATAKDVNGSNLTSSIVTAISGNGIIDTSKAGTYTITYNVTSNGKTMTAIRNILIQEEIYTNGIMSSTNKCINEGTCLNGTQVSVQVNASQKYDFYVIDDTSGKLTLMMRENLGNTIQWISKDNYDDDTNYGMFGNSNKGPITLINYLDELTDGEWYNVPKTLYTYSGISNNGSTRMYEDIIRTMRSRIITYDELNELIKANDQITPSYTYGGTGYWTSTADATHSHMAWYMDNSGNLASYGTVDTGGSYGIRPVIELYK